ncbi:hydrogen gas-evolving membrane-bound hydrogenase subunit E [uncultured Pontibacter sp.]|uniref:hydrogen gas-evolving membrane-bound hydrogenase subunit E n=1 Tax=uncultured Pontibacter sp. TaxID=453356 RepID=UPI00260F9014|nr:hydrogen gas-evolving membrane-bound hydrogenase subunit E [uncultured Pontibacter sp.]
MLIALTTCFLIAFSAPWLYKWLGKHVVIPMALLPFGVMAYLSTLLPDVLHHVPVVQTHTWVPSLGINLDFRLDGLSLLFALLITFFGGLIMIYAAAYLKDNPLLGRFYLFLTLFMAAMLGLVTADNFFSLFLFWEITSISSYLLIGFDNKNKTARTSAWQALLVTGMGGLALMGAFILISIGTGSYTFSELLRQESDFSQHAFFAPALLLILLGCFTKSAQFPFHFWLPNAMAAPTPVSAYLHSATMVKAGIYLLARLSPVFSGSEVWQLTLAGVGAATALLGAFLALQHTDMKAILAYTTISALGQMVAMLGIGTPAALKAMVVYLLAHALYKGTLFLVAGTIDHSTGSRNLNKLHGLAKSMPAVAIAATLATLSMAGIVPFLGFIGKELLYEAALESSFLVPLLFAATFLSGVAYVAVAIALGYKVFWKNTKKQMPITHAPTPKLYGPPLILGIIGVILGLAPNLLITPVLERAAQSISGSLHTELELHIWHGFTKVLALSILTLLLGLLLYLIHDRILRHSSKLKGIYALGPDSLYRRLFQGFLHQAKLFTSAIQDGNLRRYVIYIILFFSGLMLYVLWFKTPHVLFSSRLHLLQLISFHEVVLFVLVAAALLYLLGTRSRLTSIVVMGLVGYSAALIYILFGAPDVAATQLLIETLTVVIFVLLLHKLPAFIYLSHQFKKYNYIAIALLFGAVMTYTMLLVQDHAVASELKDYYGKASLAEAHGRNIVNVILVDFRGLDTLGEITVLAVAALGIFALMRLHPEKGEKP